MLFVLLGKLHVRSVLHTDLVKTAQPGHSGGTDRECRSQGKSAPGRAGTCRWGKLVCPYRHFRSLQELAATSSRLDGAESGAGLRGHLVRPVAAIIEIPAAHSHEVAIGEVGKFRSVAVLLPSGSGLNVRVRMDY